jgi:ElaB/YqjD/DUF883 family membrane-anchored ribosome-binding protein
MAQQGSTFQNLEEKAAARIGDVAKRAESVVRDGIDTAKDRIEPTMRAASDEFKQAQDELVKRSKDKPLAAAGIAAGIGIVLGMLLNRPK